MPKTKFAKKILFQQQYAATIHVLSIKESNNKLTIIYK